MAVDPDHHLIEMPNGICPSTFAPNVGGDGRTEFVRPATYCLIAQIDPSFGEQVLDVAQAQSETIIEPNPEPDDVWGKAMSYNFV